MMPLLLSLAACVLASTGCKEPPRKAIVIGRFGQDQMGEANLPHGVKTYQLPSGHGYSEALICEVENGKFTELATHELKSSESFDTLLTFSLVPFNGSPNWMAWCDQSGARQIPFLQEKLPENW